jgi:muramoyltetrapeptide carboxypeptidase
MLIPKKIQKGDKVTIVAPARKVTEKELLPAIEILKSWGLIVVIHPLLWKEENQFAGSDIDRATLLQWAINSEEIKVIFCARGGYGTVRIIDFIDFGPLFISPKWICGFSDITVLHAHLSKIGIASLHSTMPLLFQQEGGEEALNTLHNALFDTPISYELQSNKQNVCGNAFGELVGGNLSVLYSLLGSRSLPDTSSKILFLEDLDEYYYHIDRMLYGLMRAGFFENISGVVVGSMTDMHDNLIPFGIETPQMIINCLKGKSVPVIFDFPAGHIPDNRAITFGVKYNLYVDPMVSKLYV